MYYISNDLQFYAFVMMPAISAYQRKSKRWLVLTFLVLLIVLSISYLFWISITNSFSSILVIKDNTMFNTIGGDLPKKPPTTPEPMGKKAPKKKKC